MHIGSQRTSRNVRFCAAVGATRTWRIYEYTSWLEFCCSVAKPVEPSPLLFDYGRSKVGVIACS